MNGGGYKAFERRSRRFGWWVWNSHFGNNLCSTNWARSRQNAENSEYTNRTPIFRVCLQRRCKRVWIDPYSPCPHAHMILSPWILSAEFLKYTSEDKAKVLQEQVGCQETSSELGIAQEATSCILNSDCQPANLDAAGWQNADNQSALRRGTDLVAWNSRSAVLQNVVRKVWLKENDGAWTGLSLKFEFE